MEIFKNQNFLEFAERFKTDENCKEYLSNIKWNQEFKCVECNHTNDQVPKEYLRICNKRSYTETTNAHIS
jgi:hypothetical protein